MDALISSCELILKKCFTVLKKGKQKFEGEVPLRIIALRSKTVVPVTFLIIVLIVHMI